MIDTLLRLLPRHPRRLEPARLKDKLDAMGIAVTLRTVQRDLNALAVVFPLEASAGKHQGWCWCQGARQIDLPSMDPHAALTLHLVEQHLRTLLPPATQADLAPWFEAARGVVASGTSRVTQWRQKVRVVSRTLTKLPPAIDPTIQASLYEGLLLDRQVEVTYRALTTGGEAKTYPAHPLGLVVMEQVVYLVCTLRDYPDPRFLAIHRIAAAQVMEQPVRRPWEFDLDAFIVQSLAFVGVKSLWNWCCGSRASLLPTWQKRPSPTASNSSRWRATGTRSGSRFPTPSNYATGSSPWAPMPW